MGISWMEHAQEPPARKMFYFFLVQAFYASSLRSGDSQRLGRQAMFASRSGARFPRRGQRIEARIVSVFMWTFVSVPSLRTLPRELQKGALLINRGPVCRSRVLSGHPLGRPGKSRQTGKKATHLQVFLKKQRFAAEVLRFSKIPSGQTCSGALPTPPREGVGSMILRFRPETTPKSPKKGPTHATHVDPSIILNRRERKRG